MDPLTCIDMNISGMACCGEFSIDNRWYRGEILAVERQGGQTMAGVLFVDYGSFEWISSEEYVIYMTYMTKNHFEV